MIKLIMIASLMIFFTSCNPRIGVKRMCDISFQFDRCRCRDYDVDRLRAVSEAVNYPIEECEGVTGFFIDDVAKDILPKVKYHIRKCRY